jgi:acylphosphatase
MSEPRKPRQRHYATKAKMKAFVEQARELGIKVGGIELTADGTIRILSEGPRPVLSADAEYDEWKRAGN